MIESVHSVEPDIDLHTNRQPKLRKRRWLSGAVLLLVLLIVAPPWINISHFRRTIVRSISAGLERPVEASSVELQLFPRPGFVLHDLSVGEDPAFGAEPVMMAHTVTAALRASTLWHARVEIASLRFDAPSVNLVRNAHGHWNFESLLHHSPALQSGGTARAGGRLPFPYVEATEARVNFKRGAEKLPFSLEQAHLEVWRESGNQWRLRIRANPVRTDLSVEDAGQIRGEGTLTAGGALVNAPIRASLEWRRVELGEISRVLHGEDDGWRGTVDWTAEARGTLADVSLTSDVAVEEFRRAEFIPASEMDFSAHCQARYARHDQAADSLACVTPVGEGHIWLRGFAAAPASASVQDLAGTRPPVQIALDHVSAGFLLDLLGHIHPGVAADATATGDVNGQADCAWNGLHIPGNCTGKLRVDALQLQLAGLDKPLALSPVALTSADSTAGWKLASVHGSLGGAAPATLAGTADSDGVKLDVNGPADLMEINRLAQALKIPALSGEVQSIRGAAELALTMQSRWLSSTETNDISNSTTQPGMGPSQWHGNVQLQDATLKLAALPVPVELASARIDLTPTGVEWTELKGTFARIPFDGSVQWQTPCVTSNAACARNFALHTASLNVDKLEVALRNGGGSSGLLDLINPWAGGAPQLPEIAGTFRADVLSLGRVSIKNADLKLRLQGQSAELMGVSGEVFGGTILGVENEGASGAGSLHWGDGAPVYMMRVRLNGIQPDRVSAIWHESWGAAQGTPIWI